MFTIIYREVALFAARMVFDMLVTHRLFPPPLSTPDWAMFKHVIRGNEVHVNNPSATARSDV
jgi:hypothetical protein